MALNCQLGDTIEIYFFDETSTLLLGCDKTYIVKCSNKYSPIKIYNFINKKNSFIVRNGFTIEPLYLSGYSINKADSTQLLGLLKCTNHTKCKLHFKNIRMVLTEKEESFFKPFYD